MKILHLRVFLDCNEFDDDAEILIEGDDGLLHDFSVQRTEAAFDGWDGYIPEGLKLTVRND